MTNGPLTMKTTPPTMTMRNPRLNMTSKRFSSRSPSPHFQLSMMAYVPTATRSPMFEKTIICLNFIFHFFTSREAAWSCSTVGQKNNNKKLLLLFWMLLCFCLVISNDFNKVHYFPLILHYVH